MVGLAGGTGGETGNRKWKCNKHMCLAHLSAAVVLPTYDLALIGIDSHESSCLQKRHSRAHMHTPFYWLHILKSKAVVI